MAPAPGTDPTTYRAHLRASSHAVLVLRCVRLGGRFEDSRERRALHRAA